MKLKLKLQATKDESHAYNARMLARKYGLLRIFEDSDR